MKYFLLFVSYIEKCITFGTSIKRIMKNYKFEVSGDEIFTFYYVTEADNIESAEAQAKDDLIGDCWDSLKLMSITKGPVGRTPYVNFKNA